MRIDGVSRLDSARLKDELGTAISATPAIAADFDHGDMATVTITVTISALALKVLAAWLVKARRFSTVEREIEISQPDGSFRRERLRIKISEEDAAQAEVLEALEKLTRDMHKELPG